jgi:chemotaxis protein methyltransferase CheR
MRSQAVQCLTDLLKQRSGLMLGDQGAHTIESRLLPIARSQGLEGVVQLCELVGRGAKEELLAEITEAMTIGESSFFRDIKPYEQLRHIIFPMLMEKLADRKSIRIWSAACSTGQEPYSIAICTQEDAAKMPGWKFEIVGSDLARKAIDKARLGIYSQFEAQRGLPIRMLLKYFTALPDTTWQLKDNIRKLVQYTPHNLLEDYSALGKFEIIFLRNVLVYFDEATKAQITEKMANSLQPHGVLMLGATESLADPHERFTPMENIRGAYRLRAG